MQLRNGKIVSRNIPKKVIHQFYTDIVRIEELTLQFNDLKYAFSNYDDDLISRSPLFRIGYKFSGIEEHKRIVSLCIQAFDIKHSYAKINTCIQFRRLYYDYNQVVNKIRREFRVDFIFERLAELYEATKKIDSLMIRRGGSLYDAEVFRLKFSGVKIGSSCDIYELLSYPESIRTSIVPVLFYKKIHVLKLLLKKFDYPIVECICKYYIDSELFVNFMGLV